MIINDGCTDVAGDIRRIFYWTDILGEEFLHVLIKIAFENSTIFTAENIDGFVKENYGKELIKPEIMAKILGNTNNND